MLSTILILTALLIVLSLKKSRPDGFLVSELHPYRKLMFYIMPGRTESQVFFRRDIHAQPLLDYLEKNAQGEDTGLTHLLLAAIGKTLEEHHEMNRFISGRNLYQRNGVWLTFSMKRKKLDQKSAIALAKTRYTSNHSFRDFCQQVSTEIDINRSGTKTYADKEFDFFTRLPRPLLNVGVVLFRFADYYNLLPGNFMENDGLYTSVVLANLGSLDMEPGYHHLFEWGNCPIFITAGKISEQAVAEDGKISAKKVLPLRITYDERIDDGLTARAAIHKLVKVLEEPEKHLGPQAPSGELSST